MKYRLIFLGCLVALGVWWCLATAFHSPAVPEGSTDAHSSSLSPELASSNQSSGLPSIPGNEAGRKEMVGAQEREQAAAKVWSEYLEAHPLRVSGARGREPVRYSSVPPDRGLAPELEFLGGLPPDPNEDRIKEVHELRNEIYGAIHEDSRLRWDELLTSAENSGDKATMMTVLTNVRPSSLLRPDEEAVLEALRASNVRSAFHSQQMGYYLRVRRANALRQLEQGSHENPEWLAAHVEWIEEAAEKLHLSLDEESDGLVPDWEAFTNELFPNFSTLRGEGLDVAPRLRDR